MKSIVILGSTGSIGQSTLDVIKRHPERFKVLALAAYSNVDLIFKQIKYFKPKYAVLVNADAAEQLRQRLYSIETDTEILDGENALEQIAALEEADAVMAAIVGAAGLKSSMAAAKAGKRVLLANKESLVIAGRLFMQAVADNGAELLPVDSEHNAIFQCLPEQGLQGVSRVLLTASGGPFHSFSTDKLAKVSPEQACDHPNWNMGEKISVDSATLMNKGFEVIEASWLFGLDKEQIEVVIHRQSIIHSMVEYVDGSILAQMSSPDMRTPIAHALGWPERIESGVKKLDLFDVKNLDFKKPEMDRFVNLQLAFDCIRLSGTAPTILNAVNEITVAAFLQRRIGFLSIAKINAAILEQSAIEPVESIEQLLEVDCKTRKKAEQLVATEA